MTSPLTVTGLTGDPATWQVLLALELKGVAYTARQLEAGDEAPARLPVLHLEDRDLSGALSILDLLETWHPEPPLFGRSIDEAARIRQRAATLEEGLGREVEALARLVLDGRLHEHPPTSMARLSGVRGSLPDLQATLAGRRWLCGDALSAADLALYPRWALLEHLGTTPEGMGLGLATLAEEFPGIQAWAGRIRGLPGHDRTRPTRWR